MEHKQGKEIVPLKTVEEVLNWKPDGTEEIFENQCEKSEYYLCGETWAKSNKTWESLVSTPLTKEDRIRPKTLVCHDMMGGYLQDKFIDGCQEDGYYFRHWNQIDIFVYFSHHFVTIPPPGWVAAARTHGVQILGTIITEWDDGKAMLEEILSDDKKLDRFVDVCVKIASRHGFHGWLLNVENPVRAELVPGLLKLVKTLTGAIKRELGGRGLVLWYDSVTIKGELKWQDELNSLNKPFFDLCDGIFLNYTWKIGQCDVEGKLSPNNLANSINALDNDSRRTDIFVGVDVFGRGCLGGGGFQCDQPLEEIRKKGLSVALFAPGWTYEIPSRDGLAERQFFAREHTFWGLLEPFLNFHGPNLKSWCKARGLPNQYKSHSVFQTCFSLGRGSCQPARPGWFNLKKMEFQPSLFVVNEGENNDVAGLDTTRRPHNLPYSCFTTDTCSFNQSQCLKIAAEGTQTVPLFLVDLQMEKDDALLFVLTIKTEHAKSDLPVLQLRLGTEPGQQLEPRVLTSAELFTICSDWDLKLSEDKPGWQKLAFLSNETDHKFVHKIGMEIEKGGALFVGQFCLFARNTTT